MARGQRFEVNLDSDSDDEAPTLPFSSAPSLAQGLSFVKDVTEHGPADASPPPPPSLKPATSSTGFPAHKKRTQPSRFRQQRAGTDATKRQQAKAPLLTETRAGMGSSSLEPSDRIDEEKRMVDEENKQTLASMSAEEIEEQRRELLSGAVPGVTASLIERLLKRADIDEGRTDEQSLEHRPDSARSALGSGGEERDNKKEEDAWHSTRGSSGKKVTFDDDEDEDEEDATSAGETRSSGKPSSSSTPPPPRRPIIDPDSAPLVPPPDLQPASSAPKPLSSLPSPPKQSMHFPAPPSSQPSSLDPSSPNFLADLREKYFPNLPATASSSSPGLAWLKDDPPSPTNKPTKDPATSYLPTATSLPPSALRFDFRGRLLPPALSHQLPTTLGLHHHGLAPQAAGYTISELSLLARSTVSAQRCVAYQTLGRILYRLGRGDFGSPDASSPSKELYEGLWRCVEEGKALDAMVAEAGGGNGGGEWRGQGSRSAWAVATEAVWLWRLGGGKRLAAD